MRIRIDDAKRFTDNAFMSKDLADTLREAIEKCGLSALALSKETGVSQPRITEFLRGKDIRLATAQKLAKYLGLELRRKK